MFSFHFNTFQKDLIKSDDMCDEFQVKAEVVHLI